jgi:hypothetical protein
MKKIKLKAWLESCILFKINELEFEHIHMVLYPLELYAGLYKNCPLIDCKLERMRQTKMLERDLENYNGG